LSILPEHSATKAVSESGSLEKIFGPGRKLHLCSAYLKHCIGYAPNESDTALLASLLTGIVRPRIVPSNDWMNNSGLFDLIFG
jgi:alpha-ketoglutarate-dependent taurine dioxygenase